MKKYSLSRLLALSVAIVSVTACEKKPATSDVGSPRQSQSQQNLPVAAAPLRLIVQDKLADIHLPECHTQQCPEISIGHVVTSNDWVNSFLDHEILRVNQYEVNGKTITPRNFQQIADTLLETATEEDEPPSYFRESVDVSFIGVYNQLGLFSLSKDSYAQGAAHGMTSIKYYVLDLHGKKRLTLDDILLKGQRPKLDALVYHAYADWVKKNAPDTTLQAYEQDWPYRLTENYTFDQHGLTFLYQQYEMAAFAYDMPELTVPYGKLKGIIQPVYLP